MKQESNSIARVAVPLMAATLLSTPLMAQDAAAPVQVTPPPAAAPVQVTPPAAVTVTPPPVAATPAPQTAPATNSANAGADPQSVTPVNPEAAAAAEAEAQERAAAARPARSQHAAAPRAAPVRAAAAPAVNEPAPSPAPVAASAPAAPPVTTASPAAQPAPAPMTETTQQTQATSGTPIWPFVVGALVVLAGIAAFLFFRRRREEETVWEEPVYTDSVEAQPMTIEPVAAPVATAAATPAVLDLADEPVVATAEEASVSDAPAADVEALTAGETVTGRPWLEFAMRPVRAGTNDAEALVEIELTVGNAGEVTAQDVRISTFMLTAESGDVEQMLIDPPANAAVEPVTIDAGEGTRVDATLALPRSAVNGHFQPIVVADARYRLPDGSEGRTSASFLVGVSEDGVFSPIETGRGEMRDDVEAQLYREPQRA